MHPYIIPLKTLFEQNADPFKHRANEKIYARVNLNIWESRRRKMQALQKEFYTRIRFTGNPQLDIILRDLWSLPQREFQYVASRSIGEIRETTPGRIHRYDRISDHYQILVGYGGQPSQVTLLESISNVIPR